MLVLAKRYYRNQYISRHLRHISKGKLAVEYMLQDCVIEYHIKFTS